MNKQSFVFIALAFLGFVFVSTKPEVPIELPVPAKKIVIYDPQVDIPYDMRVFNKTGSQCVYCTAQMLGNIHNVQGTKNITDQYKGTSSPGQLKAVLDSRHVNFKQITNRDLNFIEEWVTQKRMGVGIGVHHSMHCILLCHFERDKLVKIIDNSDPELKVQTWTWDKFIKEWDGWAFVILPDNYYDNLMGEVEIPEGNFDLGSFN